MTSPSESAPMVSERQLVLAKREGFVVAMTRHWSSEYAEKLRHVYEAQAAKTFPLPPIVQPRVETFCGVQYRLLDGILEFSHRGEQWRASRSGPNVGSLDDCLRLRKLFTNPTETIPDTAAIVSDQTREGMNG